MIDIHSHILPGMDDGSSSIVERRSVEGDGQAGRGALRAPPTVLDAA